MYPSNSKSINILIVNDSPLQTAVIRAVVETEPNINVLGTARTGLEAIFQSKKLAPDVILMDIHMPEMDGVEATRRIMEINPKTKILITTATVNRNMNYIFEALKYGAADFVKSPSLPYAPGTQIDKKILKASGERLIQKISTVLAITFPVLGSLSNTAKPVAINDRMRISAIQNTNTLPIVGVGCSTGGPTTLAVFLHNLPRSFPGAILVCQHIDPGFDVDFASWLALETKLNVKIGKSGAFPEEGNVYISPAGKNMIVSGTGTIGIEIPSPEHIYVPNINRLFYTMSRNLGKRACGIVLTGMGNDGASGVKAIIENKGEVFIQSDETSIIDSMPKSARASINSKHGYSPAQLGAMAGNWMIKYWRTQK